MIKQCTFLGIRYLIIFGSCLCVSLIIAGILNMWTLVYPILLISPCMYVCVIMKALISNLLIQKAQSHWSRKKTVWISILLHVLYMLGTLIPIFIGLMINIYCGDVFNVYMLIAYFVVSLLGLNIFWYQIWKQKLQQVEKGENNG